MNQDRRARRRWARSRRARRRASGPGSSARRWRRAPPPRRGRARPRRPRRRQPPRREPDGLADAQGTSPSPTPSRARPPPPTPTPDADADRLVSAPLTGEPVKPRGRQPPRDRGDDRRPVRRPAAVRPVARPTSCGRRPAEGGIPRYMALFQTGTRRPSGPVRSSRLYFIAWAAEWALGVRPRRRLAAGDGAAPLLQGQGRRSCTTPTAPVRGHVPVPRSPSGSRRTTCTRTRRTSGRCGKKVGAKAVDGQEPLWKFAPDAPLEQRPEGRHDRRPVPRQQDHLQVRPQDEHLPALGDRSRASRSTRPPAEESGSRPRTSIVMMVAFVPRRGDTKGRLDGDSHGHGPAWISTNGKTIKGEWRKTIVHGAHPVLRQGRQRGHADRRARRSSR